MTTEQKKELWGDDLFNLFANHINDEGFITEDWTEIIESEVPEFDSDYNDNPKYKRAFQKMYNLEFEEKEGFIRPLKN